ncbi:MAG: phosphoribosylaminoimidazolesuccinocarboxamide synthase [SAR324 cluster bacterium]|nr:phosphoribosylaminoimidazolesuccinocarboxamide synthase [SAR324 cluster bacterium]
MVIEGKTKRIVPAAQAGMVIMETKNELTGGDAAKKATIEGIAAHKTLQTANVFNLLKKHDIPVAFIEQQNDTSLLCYECDMLPLELVMRRYAWGSFLKREPTFQQTDGVPYRFDAVRCDLYHKWTAVVPPLVKAPEQMEEHKARDRYLQDGSWQKGTYTDPYLHIDNGRWQIHPPKAPFDPSKPLMTIEPVCTEAERQDILKQLMLPCFEALENAWSRIETQFGPVALADIKIEAGRRKTDGKIVIGDVIDNDSWRIWPGGDPSKQLDKQNFRDGHPLSTVADNYALVAELTRQFLE